MGRRISRLLSFLEAYFCPICGNPSGAEICPNCRKQLFKATTHCLKCSKLLKKAVICPRCLKNPPQLDELLICFDYRDTARELVLAAKYGRNRLALKFMAGQIQEKFLENQNNLKIDLIIPIPLTKQRLEERGFNQSHYLAENLKKFAELDKKLLIKINKNPQSGIKEAELRRKNILGAFSLTDKEKIKGKNILLIDDVYTTGSTLNEAAKLLKNNKANKIFALTFAATFFK